MYARSAIPQHERELATPSSPGRRADPAKAPRSETSTSIFYKPTRLSPTESIFPCGMSARNFSYCFSSLSLSSSLPIFFFFISFARAQHPLLKRVLSLRKNIHPAPLIIRREEKPAFSMKITLKLELELRESKSRLNLNEQRDALISCTLRAPNVPNIRYGT